MTEENQGVEPNAATASEAVVSSQEQGRDYEKEAREAGWVPEAEWKGDRKPSKFLDAETFVKRGEEVAPFIRKENQRLKEAMEKKDRDYAERFARLEKVNKATFDAQERAHKAEIDRVKREQRAAAESGDLKEFDRLENVKSSLEKQAPKPETVQQADTGKDLEARRTAWRAENPWFDDDYDLQQFVVSYSTFYGDRHPEMSFEEVMKVTTAETKKRHPEKFGGARSNGHSAVDGGGNFSGTGSSPLDKLPAEARAQAQKDMKAYPKIYPNAAAWIKACRS